MSEGVVVGPERRGERWLALAVATRVSSVVSPFCEKFAAREESFTVTQMVESGWREESGTGDEREFQLESVPLLAAVRRKVSPVAHASAPAVDAAVRAVEGLASWHRSGEAGVADVMAAAIDVALEFDRHGVEAPDEWTSWVAFECAGQSELAARLLAADADLSAAGSYDVRFAAGESSMEYRNALKRWLRTSA
ncbi:hypothetical protein ACFUAG_13960 [Streptomyces sp. NPDC057193]|uniref:hypothetical protein n=1 Tax=Streptomyces sp. NPDC057193 TaxID=3346043 RepID=UPI00362A04B8